MHRVFITHAESVLYLFTFYMHWRLGELLSAFEPPKRKCLIILKKKKKEYGKDFPLQGKIGDSPCPQQMPLSLTSYVSS